MFRKAEEGRVTTYDDRASLTDLTTTVERVRRSVESVIEGKPEVVRLSLTVLLAEGHLLIEDVPGVGKTMLAKTLARSIDCSVRRRVRESLRKDLWLYPTDMVELKRGRIEVCLTVFLFCSQIAVWQRGLHSICLTWSSSGMTLIATLSS